MSHVDQRHLRQNKFRLAVVGYQAFIFSLRIVTEYKRCRKAMEAELINTVLDIMIFIFTSTGLTTSLCWTLLLQQA